MSAKQPKRVLAYLLEHGSMTALDGWRACGVYRMSDAIFKLRKQGWRIITDTAAVANQFGEKCAVARYILVSRERELVPTLPVRARRSSGRSPGASPQGTPSKH